MLGNFKLLLEHFPDRISVGLLLGVIFLFILITLYFVLLFKRLDFILFKSRNKHWATVITNLLTNFLLYTDDPDVKDPVATVLPKINKLPIKKRFLKQMLYQQILSYHANFTGNTSDKLKELFLQLHLDEILLKKLHSKQRENVIQGIRELAQMQLVNFTPQILALIKSKSLPIRMEAQAANIILNKENTFCFLADIKEPILDWYQLVLIDLATHINQSALPDFSSWLNSTNPSVVKLCLKLIGRFQQFQAVDKLITLLEHSDKEVQLLAIKVLGEFEVQEAEDDLLKLYANGSKEIKLEVIQALGRICSAKQINFLSLGASSDQFKIAFHAVNALKNHGEPGLASIKQLYTQAPKMNREIINHLVGSQLAS